MLGVEDYGSDSEDDNRNDSVAQTSKNTKVSEQTNFKAAIPTTSKASSSLALPPPSHAVTNNAVAKPKKTKKIAIGLPTISKDSDYESEEPPAKKPRTEGQRGAGSSSLLAMLPQPKQKVPTAPQPERVLGGGGGPGLVFNSGRSRPPLSASVSHTSGDEEDNAGDGVLEGAESTSTDGVSTEKSKPSTLMHLLPTSLKKGRSNVSLEEGSSKSASAPAPPPASSTSAAPSMDFFSLGSSSSSTKQALASSSKTGAASSSQISLSAAPKLEEFTPPEPTPTDPYPGYYQTPSGAWAAHNPEYYAKFYKLWQKQYDEQVRALEKQQGVDVDGATDVNLTEEMERAKKEIQEREERKRITHGAGQEGELAAPRMNIQGAKLGGRARSRHQLTTLLTEAYQNREALEERIAEGRRNRKEAGNKYGF